MDGARFDRLSKTLAAGTGRRRLLTGLGAALVGRLLLAEATGAQNYDDRGQRCNPAAPNSCNSPCRVCHADPVTGEGRCIYNCSSTQVCTASQTCAPYKKGCCV